MKTLIALILPSENIAAHPLSLPSALSRLKSLARSRTAWIALALFCLSACLLWPFLGLPLFDPDEPAYGETAREMVLYQDWLSPRIYGEVWFDKPPLFYWLTAASYSLFGISEMSARLPSVLLGTALPLYLFFSLRRVIGRTAAASAAVILVTSPLYFYLAKAAVTDMTLTFMLTIAMISFWKRQFSLFYISCGLAMLTKGPIGYAFPGIIILLYVLLTRQPRLLFKEMGLSWGVPLALAAGLPWFIAMYNLYGEAFIQGFIGYNNIIRFMSPEHPGRNSIFFFIPVLAAGFLPWAGFLAQSAGAFFTRHGEEKRFFLFLNLWAWVIFLFFSFSRTQLISYILPCLPPLAILTGCYVTKCFSQSLPSRWWIASYLLLDLGLWAAAWHYEAKLSAMVPYVFLTPALFLFAAAAAAIALLRSRLWLFLSVQAAGMVLLASAVFGLYAPHLESTASSRYMGIELAQVYNGSSLLYIDTFLRPGTAFYSGLYGAAFSSAAEKDFPAFLRSLSGRGAYLLIRTSIYGRLQEKADLPAETQIISRYGRSILLYIPSERSISAL